MNSRLTAEQAAIIGAYTGIACGNFHGIHLYAEKKLGRPIWTHEFASKSVWEELKEKSKEDFLSLCYDGDYPVNPTPLNGAREL